MCSLILLGVVAVFSFGANAKSLNLEKAVLSLTKEVRTLRNEVHTLQNENSRLRANNSPGFSAYPTLDRGYNENDRVLFDAASVNEGSHYSTTDNQFTCPVAGMYFFTLTVESLTSSDPNFWASIIKTEISTSTEEVVLSTDCYDPYDHHCSNSGLTLCQAGDVIWVRAGQNGEMSGSFDSLKCSMFAGFLVSL